MKYRVTLYGKRGRVQTLVSTKKTKITHFVQVENFAKGHLRVIYSHKLGLYNEAEFTSYEEFMESWVPFTEKTLLDYVKGWK